MTNYIEFSAKIKEKYPEYKDVDDLVLAQKIVEKYPEYKDKVTFDEVKPEKKGVDLTPSGLVKGGLASVLAPIRSAMYGEDYKTARENALANTEKFKPAKGVGDFLVDMYGYSKLPILRGGGFGNFVGNAAIQGGIPGALEGLKNNNAGGGAAAGTTIAGLLQTVPHVGGLLAKGAKKGVELAGRLGQIKPETLEQVIKPESKALEMTSDDASNALLDITKGIRENFSSLLRDRGNKVSEAVKNLEQNNNRIPLQELLDDIKLSFDNYQKDLVNPARELTGELENELLKLVKKGTPVTEIDTSLLPSGIMSKNAYNKAIRSAYKTNAGGKHIQHPERGSIYMRGNGAGETIKQAGNDYEQLSLLPQIDEITKNSVFRYPEAPIPGKPNNMKAENFDVYTGRANLRGNDIDTQIKVANTPQGKMFYLNERPTSGESGITPYGQPGDTLGSNNSITDIDAYFNSVSPLSLQGIKETIGKMANWGDETARGYTEPITEKIYSKFTDRLSELSPELKAANKAYSDLAAFKKDDTLKQILKGDLLNGDRMGNALSALKSYKSSINKAAGAKNLQELENVLVKETKQEPFLNKIDDINAAMDLLKTENTGIGGMASVAKALLTRPALAGMRKANQLCLPEKINTIKQILAPFAERMPMAASKGINGLLYGNAEYNDYR